MDSLKYFYITAVLVLTLIFYSAYKDVKECEEKKGILADGVCFKKDTVSRETYNDNLKVDEVKTFSQ